MIMDTQEIMGFHAIIEHVGEISTFPITELDKLLSSAAEAANATILNKDFHAFGDGLGVTGVLMLAESHISIHTWPERNNYSAIDIFICSELNDLNAAIDIIESIDPNAVMSVRIIDRLIPQLNKNREI